MDLFEFKRVSPTISESHDEHLTQKVSNMASAISFGIRNHGKYFDQVTYSTKLHSTKWRFDENFRRSVVVDEVSFDEVS